MVQRSCNPDRGHLPPNDAIHGTRSGYGPGRCRGTVTIVLMQAKNGLLRYERTRIERASKIQLSSNQNEWLREPGNPDWVYGYDAWRVALN